MYVTDIIKLGLYVYTQTNLELFRYILTADLLFLLRFLRPARDVTGEIKK